MTVIDLAAPSRPRPAHEPPPPKVGDFPRNGKGQPMVFLPEGGTPQALTRTTTFIDTIEDKTALTDWKSRQTLLGLAMTPWLVDAVRELLNSTLDPEGKTFKKKADTLVERALKEAGAHDKRDKGTELHGYTELIDGGIPLPEGLPEKDLLDLAEYALATVGMRFTHAEEGLVVPQLRVAGTPDRIMEFDPDFPLDPEWHFPEGASPNDPYIWDLKTGTVDYGGLKMASQLACYAHGKLYNPIKFKAPKYAPAVRKADPGWEARKAWEAWLKTEVSAEEASSLYSPIPPVNQKWGIILNLPAGTSTARLYWADLEIGWEAAELSVIIRAMRSRKGKALRRFDAASD